MTAWALRLAFCAVVDVAVLVTWVACSRIGPKL
jgi:hypothetical protein